MLMSYNKVFAMYLYNVLICFTIKSVCNVHRKTHAKRNRKINRPKNYYYFLFTFLFLLPMCGTQIWTFCQIFWLYNIGQCTTGAPSNYSCVSHLICFCGYSQSRNFLLSLRKFCIHLNWSFLVYAIRDRNMSLLGGMLWWNLLSAVKEELLLHDLLWLVLPSFHVSFSCIDTSQFVCSSLP